MGSRSNQDDERLHQQHQQRHGYELRARGTSQCGERSGRQVAVDPVLSARWAAFYPDEAIAVVTSTSKPPVPPSGEKSA